MNYSASRRMRRSRFELGPLSRAIAAQPPTPLKIMARTAPESPINDVVGALANEGPAAGSGQGTSQFSRKRNFSIKASATTTPGLLKVAFLATASRSARPQRRLLRLGTAPAQQKPRKLRCREHDKDPRPSAVCCNTSRCSCHNAPERRILGWDIPPFLCAPTCWVCCYFCCTC